VVDNITIRNVSGNFGSFGALRGNTPDARRGTNGATIGNFTIENFNVTLNTRGGGDKFTRGEVGNFVFKNVVVNGQPVEAPPATVLAPAAGRGGPGAPAAPATADPATSAAPAQAPAAMNASPPQWQANKDDRLDEDYHDPLKAVAEAWP
jgi:hypothetical protein